MAKAEPGYYLAETNLYGNGVFVRSPIPKGVLICTLGGDHVSLDEMVMRVLSGDEAINNPLQVGMQQYIICDEISRSFNHSCSPNTIACGKSDLISIREIATGEEITFDYSLTIAPTDWQMDCLCGSASCRKVASDVSTVPDEILKGYFDAGLLQDYMREILPDILAGTYVIPQFELDALNRLSGSR